MILPKNGRIVILDDKLEQAYPLIKALSKQKIPFCFHSDEFEFLPPENEPYSDVRLLLLDINLSADDTPIETIKAQLQKTLKRIIKPRTPYIAAIWSLKENQYEEMLTELFDKIIPELKPIQRVSLAKSEFFILGDVQDGSTVYIEDPEIDIVVKLNEKIIQALASIDSFEALIKWENIVAISTSDVTNEIVSLASGNVDLNEDLKKIYFKLAEALWGRQLYGTTQDIVSKSVSVFNELLNDRLIFNVKKLLNLELIKEIKIPEDFNEKAKAIFNSKLLLNFEVDSKLFPGNVYERTGEDLKMFPFKNLIADSILVPQVAYEFYKNKFGKEPESEDKIMECKKSNKREYEAYEKEIRDLIKPVSKYVTIEVSPICDFAQNKWKMSRICPAVLWHSDYHKYIGKSENLYISPVLSIGEECYYLIIDLRYFSSTVFDTFNDLIPICGLKHSFLTDIQSLLSRHINRPGINSLK